MPAQPKLHLHIGGGKSGSSAIQAALRENHRELRAIGVLVPASDLSATGRVDGHQVSFFQNLLPVDDAAVETVTQRLEDLRRYADRHDVRAVAISSENLLNARHFARLFAEAPRLFDLQVIVYIRRQDDYLLAAWNQWHFKIRDDLDKWLEGVKGTLGDWYLSISEWEKELPGVHFNVRVFDRKRLIGQDVVRDFMHILDVPTQALSLPAMPVNQGLNDVAMRVAKRNRRLFRDEHDNRFTDFLSDFGGDLAHAGGAGGLSPETRRVLRAAYRDSNELLRQRYLPTLPIGGLFEDEVVEEPAPLSDQELLLKELDLLWSIVFRLYGGLTGEEMAALAGVTPKGRL